MKRILIFLMVFLSIILVGCNKKPVATDNLVTESSFDLKVVENVSEIKDLREVDNSGGFLNGFFESIFGGPKIGNAAPPGASFDAELDDAQATTGVSSKTNVQVEGVDEADTIKSDERYIYIINGLKITVVDSVNDTIYAISFDGKMIPDKMYLKDNLLIVLGSKYTRETVNTVPQGTEPGFVSPDAPEGRYIYNLTTDTVISVIDVNDKTNMEELRSITYTNSYLASSRMIDNHVYMVLNQQINTSKDVNIPYYEDTTVEGNVETPLSSMYIMQGYKGYYSYNILSSFDVSTSDVINYEVYLGNFRDMYSSLSNMYVINQVYTSDYSNKSFRIPQIMMGGRFSGSFSNIYRFSIEDGKMEFIAKAIVAGYIKDQFSMDEYDGTFRIASTVESYESDNNIVSTDDGPVISIAPNNFLNRKTENFVYTFDIKDNKFTFLDSLGGIGVNENIYSVRFDKYIGFVVTFRQIDPLYKIDFIDPSNIVIIAELKSPGVSDYLHIHNDDYIVGIGRASAEHNSSVLAGVKISLFKVSGTELEEVDTYIFEGEYSNTPVTYDHLSLITLESQNLYIFPINIYDGNSSTNSIAVIEINTDLGKVILRGLISKQLSDAFYYDSPRAVVVNSKLYSFFNSEIVVNALDDDFTNIKSIELEVIDIYNGYGRYNIS